MDPEIGHARPIDKIDLNYMYSCSTVLQCSSIESFRMPQVSWSFGSKLMGLATSANTRPDCALEGPLRSQAQGMTLYVYDSVYAPVISMTAVQVRLILAVRQGAATMDRENP